MFINSNLSAACVYIAWVQYITVSVNEYYIYVLHSGN